MADKKISALPAAATPLAGTEVLPIVQSGATVKVSIADVTAGRAVSATSVIAGLGAVSTPSYTFTGDLDTGMWSSAANVLAFSTSGTERITIRPGGNVGVGIAMPGANLDVKGLVRSSIGTGTGAGGAAYAFYQFGSSTTPTENWHIGTEGDGSFRFYNQGFGAGLERVQITSAGDVGIGTAPNASAILDVQSTTKGLRLPNMTTAQKNAIANPAAGLMVFDTTLSKACVYTGAAWQTITSA